MAKSYRVKPNNRWDFVYRKGNNMPSGVYKRNLKPIIKAGDKYNKLTAIRFSHNDKRYNQYWLFKCDCGNEKVICVYNVKNGGTKACGCLKKRGNFFKHGMSRTQIYKSWDGIKQRCFNKNYKYYKDYGGRGITVCERWMKFENFFEDMGNMPKGKSIDRINNDGNYEPNNCKWSTRKEQQNNRRTNRFITYKNKTLTIAQWARKLNMDYSILYMKIKRGDNIKRLLENKLIIN